jgi:hypothetical protein
MAHRIKDLDPPRGEHHGAWDIQVVSEPFTTGSEDVDTDWRVWEPGSPA